MVNPFATIERAILSSLRESEKNKKLKVGDIAWALGDRLPDGYEHAGDKVVHLTIMGNQPVTACFAASLSKAQETKT